MARGSGPAYSDFMSAARQRSPRLIGIVDDDPGVREAISSLIRSEGFRTAVFSSGEECLGSEDLRKCCVFDSGRTDAADERSRPADAPVGNVLASSYHLR